MHNRVVLIGRLTRGGSLNYNASGKAVSNVGLAVERARLDQHSGASVVTGVDSIELVLEGRLAEALSGHLVQGRLVGIEGKIRTREIEVNAMPVNTSEVVVDGLSFLDNGRPNPA